ncbi:30S ribosomal protein S21 [Candidatus Calescamantes bacterium]|nr:30S ribosomal protein S21 [bacterium]MCK5224411.1 30S ribosomal protein S21 [Candidatus Calescamantes bacterium]MCK5399018.1 30S ribosomal protein S21 [bacterium]MCK5598948.1 30S ribosomal protein S21 [bacterium]
MVRVYVNSSNVEKALKILKKKIAKEGILSVLKNKRYYDKPSIALRKKIAKANRRRRRRFKRMQKYLIS